MHELANVLVRLVDMVLQLAQLIVIVSVILSWVAPMSSHPAAMWVRRLSEPMYKPFRNLTAKWTGPIDISPIFVLVIIAFLQRVLPQLIFSLVGGPGGDMPVVPYGQ